MKKLFITILTTLLLTGCGTPRFEKPNTDLPTLIEIVNLDSGQQVLKIRLTHRQAKPREASRMTCELALDDEELTPITAIDIPELTAYAREVLQLELPKSLTLLNQKRIDYRLGCQLNSPETRDEHIVSRGTLYRLANQSPPVYR